MKEEKQERLFRAIGDVGGDLIDMAEKQTFAPSAWRKWGSLAACLAVLLCLGMLALPYLPMGCGSENSADSAVSSQMEPALDTAESETAVPEEGAPEEPAAEAPASEEPAETPAAAEDNSKASAQQAAREQLVFRNTVYYLEAHYSKAEGEAARGEYLGTVEDGDRAEWTGCGVYSYHSYAENQTEAPIDILVAVSDGYLYCVTYHLRAGAPFDIVDTLYLLEHGGEETAARRFTAVFEAADFTFDAPASLTADRLTEFFCLTLQMEREAGIRTEDVDKYLWYDEQNDCYAVPAEDMKRQLDRYLSDYSWEPAQTVFRLHTSALETKTPQLYAWEYEAGILTLTVERAGESNPPALRRYTIEFTGNACRYRSIVPEIIDN